MSLKKVIRDLVDAVDGAGHEFKSGFAGAFRKRGSKHRTDADAIRGLDRRNADSKPTHRAEPKRPKYDILKDVTRAHEALGKTPSHRGADYNPIRDLGGAVGQAVRELPGDVGNEIKGIPKKTAKQLVEELYEDAIGQRDPDEYGRKPSGDMQFLAPAGEDLSALSPAELESRFDLEPGSLEGATVKIEPIPDSRFAKVEIEYG